MIRRVWVLAFLALTCGLVLAAGPRGTLLPSGWRIDAPQGRVAGTGTMPQGIAISPDGGLIAVVESGVAPATLRTFDAGTLTQRAAIPLADAFGRPAWLDADRVLVAGGSTHALLDVDLPNRTVRSHVFSRDAYYSCLALSPDRTTVAMCDDANGTAAIATLADFHLAGEVSVGAHPSAAIFSPDGKTLYVASRQTNSVAVIDTGSRAVVARVAVGLHPAALALSSDGSTLYVAESDDDSVGIVDTRTRRRTGGVSVELRAGRATGFGASPNALAVSGGDVFVGLGAQNAVGVIRAGSLVERVPAGWYPTDVARAADGRLFVSNGKGERAPANPQFDPRGGSAGYVALITTGSLREIPPAAYRQSNVETGDVIANAEPQWTAPPAGQSIVRANGPIRHVIYIIKENRSYDQVLGDVPGANGDPALAWFGRRVTPNQHAIARRFGVFDNAYVNAQVSADGHNWTDASFANDYVERFWPPNYGGRRKIYDFQQGNSPDVPHNGYLWDAAKRAGITYRDYGEDLDWPEHGLVKMALNTMPGLAGHFDPHYAGWDLSYMDTDRFAEWLREFRGYVSTGTLPALEIVYFPGDHTAGTDPAMRTPQAYVAMNDWAVGKLVDAVSHSRYWRSTAIFALEDDAQNGPDHVSDQRSTFYVASPFARPGVRHEHYSTASVVHTIELLLGLRPLSIYDATARPLYDAFANAAVNRAPYAAVRPNVDMKALNSKAAFGARASARMDFSKPDAVDPRELNEILAHAVNRP